MQRMKAILVADCLENSFEPLDGQEIPQTMFPIANVPNLQYVIEMLVMSQITEIFLVARASNGYRDKLKAFVKEQNYTKRGIKVKVIGITDDAKNLGDVLRQVSEMKGLIKDDFVLIRGDLVTNIDLRPAIKMHY